jgi:long-chain acyl-CoA synthetase
MNPAQWLQRAAAVFADRPAIASGQRVAYTYRGFAHAAQRGARAVLHRGLQPGERVGLFMDNSADYIVLLWSVWWAGGVAVPMNARLHGREASYILAHCTARLCLVDAAHGAALRGHVPAGCTLLEDHGFLHGADAPLLPPPRDAGDAAWLFYTSGTTGRPKGVTLTARNLLHMALAYLAEAQPVAPGDTILHPAPLSHGSGLYHLPYVMNGGVNVVPASGGLDCAEMFALAAHWRNASCFAAPTIVNRLVAHARETRTPVQGWATLVYGGAPMYLADLDAALEVFGGHLAQIYGQGESPMTITVLPRHVIDDRAHPRWRERVASVGYAQPMLELSIRSPDGHVLPPGETGEVCVRGDVVMSGYWLQPEATAGAVRDGWLWTGDVGRLDGDGFLTLLDRSKDLVISGGNNVYPREIEEVLLLHPAVREVAVIGRHDATWGESLVAYVVAQADRAEGDLARQLDAHCLAHIARYKRPKRWRFVDSLPKNNYGKVLKTALREAEAAIGDATPGDRNSAA